MAVHRCNADADTKSWWQERTARLAESTILRRRTKSRISSMIQPSAEHSAIAAHAVGRYTERDRAAPRMICVRRPIATSGQNEYAAEG
jgi:hypothetical protein